MATVKVWNLTDVSTDRPRVLGICNQSVRPGKHCLVPTERLPKLNRLVAAQYASVGENPPDWYLKAKVVPGTASQLPHIAPLPGPVKEEEAPPAPEPKKAEPAPEPEPEKEKSKDGLELKSKKQLRALCEEKKLSPEGSKTDLLNRLREAQEG